MPKAFLKKEAKAHGKSVKTEEKMWKKAEKISEKEGYKDGSKYAVATKILKDENKSKKKGKK